MDRIKNYQKILRKTLKKHAALTPANMPTVTSQLIISEDAKNFILLDIGWNKEEFIHDLIFHLEIKENKVHFHKNMTDFDLVEELVEEGIAKEDFVFTMLNEPVMLTKSQLGEAA